MAHLQSVRAIDANRRDHGAGFKVRTLAGPVFEEVDQFLGKLGNPVGLKSYKPYYSSEEVYL